MRFFVKPVLSVFDVFWITAMGLLSEYLGAPWLFWVMIVPMMIVSTALQNKFAPTI